LADACEADGGKGGERRRHGGILSLLMPSTCGWACDRGRSAGRDWCHDEDGL